MSKKRLEEVVKNVVFNECGLTGALNAELPEDDYWYLYEQAERVQELEKQIADDEHFVAEILEQNRRYREVINQIKNNIPLEFKHISEYEAKKNVIRLINIDNLVNEYLEGEE